MKRSMMHILACSLGLATVPAALAQPLGTAFVYQGQLKLSDAPLNADADFQFSLWTAATGGTQVGATIPVNALSVDDGLFSTSLNFGATAFNGDERYLQIAVRSPAGSGTFTTLAPRQRVAATPYALQTRGIFTDATERVGIGTIAPLTPLHVAGNGATLALEGTDHTFIEFYPDGAAAGRKAFAGYPTGTSSNFTVSNDIVGGHIIFQPNANVGIGTASPSSRLHVNGSTRTTTLDVTDELTMPSGVIRRGGAPIATNDLGLYSLNGSAWLRLVSTNAPIQFFTDSADGSLANPPADSAAMTIGANGFVGIGTHSPVFPLSFPNTLGDKIALWGASGNNFGFGVQSNLLQIHTSATTADIAFGSGSSASFTERMRIKGTGRVGIGTASPAADLHIVNGSSGQQVFLMESNAPAGTWLNIDNTAAGRRWNLISTGSANGEGPGKLLFRANDSGVVHMTMDGDGNVGIGTVNPVAKLDVAGIARCDVLQIDAGADVAENYDVAAIGPITPQPGMVVSIDTREIGKLILSDTPYDRRVAGIISGAGDVRPGLVLSQPGTVADGEWPVASMGRVWCMVDADANGPIAAGDLLSTSATPGHAMRASDASQAAGATIGKAMSPLKQGRGLVLVLVSLQ